MNRILKILKRFFAIIISLCIVLILIAEMAEDTIVHSALNEVNSSIDAAIKIEDVSFSLLKKFPYATVEFKNVSLQSKSTLKADTLLSSDKIYVSLNTISLLKGNFETEKVELKNGYFNYQIDKNGTSNFDCLFSTHKDSTVSQNNSSLHLDLKKVSLNNIHLFYFNSNSSVQAEILIDETEVKGKIVNNTYKAEIEGNALLSNCKFKNSNLHKMKNAEINYQIAYINDSLQVNLLQFISKGANLKAKGTIALTNQMQADINLTNCELELNKLHKYLPEEIKSNYKISKIDGLLSLSAKINGKLIDSIPPQIKASVQLTNGILKKDDYPTLKNLNFKGQFNNGKKALSESTQIKCEQLHFETEKSSGDLTFELTNLNQPKYNFESNLQINFDEIKTYIPDSLININAGISKMEITGIGKLDSFKDLENPDYILQSLNAKINLENVKASNTQFRVDSLNATLFYSPNKISVSKVQAQIPSHNIIINKANILAQFNGKLSNLAQLNAKIDSFYLETSKSTLSGNIKMQNLNYPKYTLDLKTNLNLAELKSLIPDSLLTNINGNINTQFNSSGRIHPDSLSEQITNIICNKSILKTNCKNISIHLNNPEIELSNFSGNIAIMRDTIKIMNTNGELFGINFKIDSTQIKNYYNTLIANKKQELSIDGLFHFNHINYHSIDSLLANFTNNSDTLTNQSSKKEKTQYTYLVKGKLSGESFTYKKANFTDISSLFNISDSTILLDKFRFNAFEGNMNNSLRYKIVSNNKKTIDLYNQTKELNIARLMKDFDNFKEYDQAYIESEQISGKLTSDLHGQFLLLGDSLVNDSSMLKGDIKLENGGLFNFKPVMELSKSTNIDELDNLQFKTIESKVFVYKNAVYVPQTEIKSNAMDISAYGMQSFGDDYEYHLRIYLGEILHGKTKRIREKQQKQENKPDGGTSGLTSLFVVSKCKDGKTHSGLDTKKGRMKMKTKIKLQQVVLDLIFHPKLVNFETDQKK
nr:AsmA family protein [uncultured Marinifilum sp.]